MKKIIVGFSAIGFFAVSLAAAPLASAQTVPDSTVPASVVAMSDPSYRLDLLTVQVAALAVTPIVTVTDQSQALLILQSIERGLENLSTQIGTS